METIKNYVIIKISAMGDNIMAFPVANQIKQSSPNSKVFWVCGDKSSSLADLQQNIDYVFSINEERLLRGNRFLQLIEIFKVWLFLIKIKNKSVHILHSDNRYRILYPFIKRNQLFHQTQGTHHSFQYQRLLGLPLIDPDNFYSLKLEKLPAIKTCYDIILVPGGAKNTLRTDNLRRYPIEKYVDLYNELIKRNLKVCLIGSKEDIWVHDYFSLDVDSYIGKLSILETLSLIKNSKTLISHDTGPMHFGAMLGSKVISLFGPTKKSDKEPLTNKASVSLFEPNELSCAPCYDNVHYSSTCTDPICLRNITSTQIISYVVQDIQ